MLKKKKKVQIIEVLFHDSQTCFHSQHTWEMWDTSISKNCSREGVGKHTLTHCVLTWKASEVVLIAYTPTHPRAWGERVWALPTLRVDNHWFSLAFSAPRGKATGQLPPHTHPPNEAWLHPVPNSPLKLKGWFYHLPLSFDRKRNKYRATFLPSRDEQDQLYSTAEELPPTPTRCRIWGAKWTSPQCLNPLDKDKSFHWTTVSDPTENRILLWLKHRHVICRGLITHA